MDCRDIDVVVYAVVFLTTLDSHAIVFDPFDVGLPRFTDLFELFFKYKLVFVKKLSVIQVSEYLLTSPYINL